MANSVIELIQKNVYDHYHFQLSNAAAENVLNAMNKAYGASESTLDVIRKINMPYSQERQILGSFAIAEHKKEFQQHQHLLDIAALIQRQKALVASLAQHPGTHWGQQEVAEQDLRRLEESQKIEFDEKSFWERMEQKQTQLNNYYTAYQELSEKYVSQEKQQRETFNQIIEKNGLSSKYKLTPQKQLKLHDIFAKVNFNSPPSLLNAEIQYMAVMLQPGEQQNLKPSEVALLARLRADPNDKDSQKLFDMFVKLEKDSVNALGELNAVQKKIMRVEDDIARDIQARENKIKEGRSYVEHMQMMLSPQFLRREKNEEVLEDLDELRKIPSPSTMDPNSAMQFRLGMVIRQMSAEQKQDFLTRIDAMYGSGQVGDKALNQEKMNLLGVAYSALSEYGLMPEIAEPEHRAKSPFDIPKPWQ